MRALFFPRLTRITSCFAVSAARSGVTPICGLQTQQPGQGRSKPFEGGVAKVYIPHVVSIGGSGGMLPQEDFVKGLVLRPCLASNLTCFAILSKQNFNSCYMHVLSRS